MSSICLRCQSLAKCLQLEETLSTKNVLQHLGALAGEHWQACSTRIRCIQCWMALASQRHSFHGLLMAFQRSTVDVDIYWIESISVVSTAQDPWDSLSIREQIPSHPLTQPQRLYSNMNNLHKFECVILRSKQHIVKEGQLALGRMRRGHLYEGDWYSNIQWPCFKHWKRCHMLLHVATIVRRDRLSRDVQSEAACDHRGCCRLRVTNPHWAELQ